MGRKHVTSRFQVITNGVMAANIESAITDVEQCDHCRYTGVYTSPGNNVVGTFHIWSSDDKVNWSELNIAPYAAIAAGDDFDFLIQTITFKYIKLTYVATGGAGTLNAYIKAATIGA